MDQPMDSRHKAECAAIRFMINGIAELCAGDPLTIIDLLSKYLFTPDETEEIKRMGSNV